eukprot:COSAG06_NODE_2540_length_6706_cov_9.446647_3_plen_180_part_00
MAFYTGCGQLPIARGKLAPRMDLIHTALAPRMDLIWVCFSLIPAAESCRSRRRFCRTSETKRKRVRFIPGTFLASIRPEPVLANAMARFVFMMNGKTASKMGLFSQRFLCLSRACLGKMIVLYTYCSKGCVSFSHLPRPQATDWFSSPLNGSQKPRPPSARAPAVRATADKSEKFQKLN